MRLFLIIGFVFFNLCLCGQSRYQAGWLPSINLNKKVSSKWKLNLKLESRQSLKAGVFGAENEVDYEYVLTDLAVVAARKIGLSSTLAGGYLARFREDKMIQRLIQQFAFVQRLSGLRLGHRIASDQTFELDEATEIRLRYRLTFEIPFNGESVDPNEFYLKINHEYLNSFQADEYDLEIRLVPVIGYKFLDKNKLEVGLDYRLSSLLNSPSRNRFWFSTSWYLAF